MAALRKLVVDQRDGSDWSPRLFAVSWIAMQTSWSQAGISGDDRPVARRATCLPPQAGPSLRLT